jgi:hypothetical protein
MGARRVDQKLVTRSEQALQLTDVGEGIVGIPLKILFVFALKPIDALP